METKGAFTPLGEPWKKLPWQVTEGLDKFGNKRFQIKYYRKKKNGGWNFQKFQVIYATPTDWTELKKSIRKRGKE